MLLFFLYSIMSLTNYETKKTRFFYFCLLSVKNAKKGYKKLEKTQLGNFRLFLLAI